MKPWIFSSCKPPVAYLLKNSWLDSEVNATHNGVFTLSAEVVSKTGIDKFPRDVLRLDLDAYSQAISVNHRVQYHSLFNLIQKEIGGLQDQLARFGAKIERLVNDLLPEPKRCCYEVLTSLLNNHPIIHASQTVRAKIHLTNSASAGTRSPLATPSVIQVSPENQH